MRTLAFMVVRQVRGLVGLGCSPDVNDVEIAVDRDASRSDRAAKSQTGLSDDQLNAVSSTAANGGSGRCTAQPGRGRGAWFPASEACGLREVIAVGAR